MRPCNPFIHQFCSHFTSALTGILFLAFILCSVLGTTFMEPVKLTHNGFNKIPKKSHYENQQKIMYIYFFWKKIFLKLWKYMVQITQTKESYMVNNVIWKNNVNGKVWDCTQKNLLWDINLKFVRYFSDI